MPLPTFGKQNISKRKMDEHLQMAKIDLVNKEHVIIDLCRQNVIFTLSALYRSGLITAEAAFGPCGMKSAEDFEKAQDIVNSEGKRIMDAYSVADDADAAQAMLLKMSDEAVKKAKARAIPLRKKR